MVFQMPQYWDVAIDGIQIVLCVLILLFLIRGRRKKRPVALEAAIRESGQGFKVQVFIQTLKQQVNQAFANIADTIAVEQRNLDQVLSISSHGQEDYNLSEYQSPLHAASGREIAPIAGEAPGSDPLHEQIQQLAVKGMSARQISETLKTPLGEVELVLSLRSSLGN
jgi:hypothetical protein